MYLKQKKYNLSMGHTFCECKAYVDITNLQKIICMGLSCAQLSCEYHSENRVVASNSHQISRKYGPGSIRFKVRSNNDTV